MPDFTKQEPGAPGGLFEAEAAGLEWLAAPGFVAVAEVFEVGRTFLRMERVPDGSPNAKAAARFGEDLARLHTAGAPAFGYTPADRAFFGPGNAAFELRPVRTGDFTEFWLARIDQLAGMAAPALSSAAHDVQDAIKALSTGVFAGIAGGDAEPPARVHGDLWSGNLLWSGGSPERTHAVLIDPAAHGGHPLEDIAMLELFGAPYLEAILTGYAAQRRAHGRPLPEDWKADLPAHRLFALLAHVHLFGAAYAEQTVATAEAVVGRAEYLAEATPGRRRQSSSS